MATRLGCRFTEHHFPQSGCCPRFELSCFCPAKCREQTTRVAWRAEQVRCLRKPGELARRNQGDVARASSTNNNSFLLIYYLIEHGGEVLPETGVRCFTRHGILD